MKKTKVVPAAKTRPAPRSGMRAPQVADLGAIALAGGAVLLIGVLAFARPSTPIVTSVAAAAAVEPHAVIANAKKTLTPKAERLSGSEANARSAAAAVPTGTSGTSPITITGCLEGGADHDGFRLTDTDGADAPASRSWRSGFLKKRSGAVALVDPPSRLALRTHVGRRVTATGLLSGHDLKVSALRFVGPACS